LLIWTICARARFFPIWSSFRFWALAAVVELALDPVLARAATAVVLLLFCGVAGGRGGRDGGASLALARPRRAPPRRRPACLLLPAVSEVTVDAVVGHAATAVVLLLFFCVEGGRGGRDRARSLRLARPHRAPPRRRPEYLLLPAISEVTVDAVVEHAATAVVLLLFFSVAGGRGGRDGGAVVAAGALSLPSHGSTASTFVGAAGCCSFRWFVAAGPAGAT